MDSNVVYNYDVPSGGGTLSINYNRPYQVIHLSTNGAVTLASNFTLNYTGTPSAEGSTVLIFCDFSLLTLGANKITLLGYEPRQTFLTAGPFLIIGTLSNNKVEPVIIPSIDKNQIIEAAQLVDSTITDGKIGNSQISPTKFKHNARGFMFRNGASAWELFDAKTSGNLLIGNGTDVVSVPMTGDGSLNGSGVLTIANGAITPDKLSFTLASYFEVTYTLSSAQILDIFSTPVSFIGAPGTKKYLELISATAVNQFNTTAYSNGADLLELRVGSNKVWEFPNAFTEASVTTISQGTKVANAIITANEPLTVTTTSANPTLGDGEITLKVIYAIRSY
jgi:hypothetical protein